MIYRIQNEMEWEKKKKTNLIDEQTVAKTALVEPSSVRI